MASRILKGRDVFCYSCGSSLLRISYVRGLKHTNCMVCCSGEHSPSDEEFMLNDGETREIFGRESGRNSGILSRTNTPWSNASHYLDERNTRELLINKRNRN